MHHDENPNPKVLNIIGAGLAGASLALALSRQNLSITLMLINALYYSVTTLVLRICYIFMTTITTVYFRQSGVTSQ